MKLRMDHGAGKGNHAPGASIGAAHHDAAGCPLLDRRRQPLPARSQRALAKLRAGELHNASFLKARAIDLPNAAAAHEEYPLTVRMDRRRKRMDRRTVS